MTRHFNHRRGAEINFVPDHRRYQETLNPEKPTPRLLKIGKRRRATEVIEEARILGDELLEEWEKWEK